jgi:hypothetical protein
VHFGSGGPKWPAKGLDDQQTSLYCGPVRGYLGLGPGWQQRPQAWASLLNEVAVVIEYCRIGEETGVAEPIGATQG